MSEEAKVRDQSAAAELGPDLERQEILVPGGHGTAFVARAGQLVEMVDVEGQQCPRGDRLGPPGDRWPFPGIPRGERCHPVPR